MYAGRSFLYFLFVLCLYTAKIEAQSSIVFYDLIQDDSVALYFNKDFMFTEEECHDYVRRIRVTASGDFNGYFEDYSVAGKMLAKGVYSNGLKHGYFEAYYTNGTLFSRGYYENNTPVGNWEFYYPNGLLERVITLTGSTVLLMRHIDETGTVRVENGTGNFDGAVRLARDFKDLPLFAQTLTGMRATGKVVAGRPDGKWFIPDRNRQGYYMEKFDNGKLLKSSRMSRRKMKNDQYHPKLDAFFLDNYLTTLETFERESCSESQKYFFNKYPSDFRTFSYDLRQKMNYIIDTDLRSGRKSNYSIGDNFMSVRFYVDDKGKPYDITVLSDWGQNFLKITENSLNKTVFSTHSKTMYFHLKVSYAGGYRYKYNFRFSKRDRIR
jgi:hypothetical protein